MAKTQVGRKILIYVMAPPSYNDLGKASRDVLNKGYHFGLWKLDCKSKTKSGIQFNTVGVSDQDSGKVKGSLETKYKIDEYGVTLTEKWDTDNTLHTEVSVQDQLLEGLKLGVEGAFSPETSYKQIVLKAGYGHENVKFDCDSHIFLTGPVINYSLVLGYQGWLAGYQAGYQFENMNLYKNNFALGYTTKDFALHTAVNGGQEFKGEIFQRISDNLDCGIQLSWKSGESSSQSSQNTNSTHFGIGATYTLDKDASFRGKINNKSQIGLGYQQKLREGITLFLSTMVDAKNFNSGNHKVGVALEMQS